MTDDQLQAFQAVYEAEFGLRLPRNEVLEAATLVLRLIEAVHRPNEDEDAVCRPS